MLFKFDHLTKVKKIKVKEKKSKQILTNDELIGISIGYKNQYIKTIKYVFENDKAVACYNTIESENEIFLKVPFINDNLTKNIKRNGNIITYEWDDDYFEEKGKGCSKEEIKQFLKKQNYKIKK